MAVGYSIRNLTAGDALKRADRWSTTDISVDLALPKPTRIPALNDILATYRRVQFAVA